MCQTKGSLLVVCFLPVVCKTNELQGFAETKVLNTPFTASSLILQCVGRFTRHLFEREEALIKQQSVCCFLII